MKSTGESNQSKGKMNVTNSNCADQESSYITSTEMRGDNKRHRKQIEEE